MSCSRSALNISRVFLAIVVSFQKRKEKKHFYYALGDENGNERNKKARKIIKMEIIGRDSKLLSEMM